MSRMKTYFGYLNEEGTLIKLSKAGEQGEVVILEETCLEVRLMGECKILGYYRDVLIVVDREGRCFSVEV